MLKDFGGFLKPCILIVEDNPMNRELSGLLEVEGYESVCGRPKNKLRSIFNAFPMPSARHQSRQGQRPRPPRLDAAKPEARDVP